MSDSPLNPPRRQILIGSLATLPLASGFGAYTKAQQSLYSLGSGFASMALTLSSSAYSLALSPSGARLAAALKGTDQKHSIIIIDCQSWSIKASIDIAAGPPIRLCWLENAEILCAVANTFSRSERKIVTKIYSIGENGESLGSDLVDLATRVGFYQITQIAASGVFAGEIILACSHETPSNPQVLTLSGVERATGLVTKIRTFDDNLFAFTFTVLGKYIAVSRMKFEHNKPRLNQLYIIDGTTLATVKIINVDENIGFYSSWVRSGRFAVGYLPDHAFGPGDGRARGRIFEHPLSESRPIIGEALENIAAFGNKSFNNNLIILRRINETGAHALYSYEEGGDAQLIAAMRSSVSSRDVQCDENSRSIFVVVRNEIIRLIAKG